MTNQHIPFGTIIFLTVLFGFFSGAVGGAFVGYYGVPSALTQTRASDAENNGNGLTLIEESATASAVEAARSSVVSIVITKELQRRPNTFGIDPFFNDFFGQIPVIPESSEGETEKVEIGGGTGFIISDDGLILTNRHVVNDPDASYTVVFDDETTMEAKVLARDTLSDLAIIKVDAEGLTPLPVGDSDSLVQGQTVIAIGNTLGEYQNTVTKGIISGLQRDLGGNLTGLIQTDAAINQGNSGGPLLNLQGQVIGINTAVDRSGEGIGFAIPIDEAKVAIESVKANGRIIRPALGIRYTLITKEIADANNLLYDYGAYIRHGGKNSPGVIPGSVAEQAGLQEGDIILEFDGVKIDAEHPLADMIKGKKVGDTVSLKIFRDRDGGEGEQELTLTLAELPQSS